MPPENVDEMARVAAATRMTNLTKQGMADGVRGSAVFVLLGSPAADAAGCP